MSFELSNNKYDSNILEEKDKKLFNLIFPDFKTIPWYMKPTHNYINLIMNNFSFNCINEEDIQIFIEKDPFYSLQNKNLGDLIGLLCSGNSNLLKCAEIFAEFEKRLNNIIPEKSIISLQRFLSFYDKKLKNEDIKLKNKFNNIKSINPIILYSSKIIDTYDLLHLEFNEKIIIGRFNKEGKTCYGAIEDKENINNIIISDFIPFDLDYEDFVLFTSYIICISNLFHVNWNKSIVSAIYYNCSFRKAITGCYNNYNNIKINVLQKNGPSLITIKNSFIKIVTLDTYSLLPYIYEDKIILPKLRACHLLYFKRNDDYYDIGPYIFYRNLLPDDENLKYALNIGLIDDVFYNYWIYDLE